MSELIPGACLTSGLVDLFPCGLSEAEGFLPTDEGEYLVKVGLERGKRVWARVVVKGEIESEERRREAFYEAARRGVKDPEWRPLCVDPRDGETLYSVTLSRDLSSEALDRFLAAAKGFLEHNRGELEQILEGGGGEGSCAGLDELVDLFGIEES